MRYNTSLFLCLVMLGLMVGACSDNGETGLTQKGVYGANCITSADCQSGICILLGGSTGTCSTTCTTSCPKGDPCVSAGSQKVCKPSVAPTDGGLPDITIPPDKGCPGVICGSTCCGSGQTCYQTKCCTPNCQGKSCGDDGCGGSCGTCPPKEGTYTGSSNLKFIVKGSNVYVITAGFSCSGTGSGSSCTMTNDLNAVTCSKSASGGLSGSHSNNSFSFSLYSDSIKGTWITPDQVQGSYFVTGSCCSDSVSYTATLQSSSTADCP